MVRPLGMVQRLITIQAPAGRAKVRPAASCRTKGSKIMTIKVTGISSKGTTRTINYLVLFVDDTYKAIANAMESANREYTCEYDENLKPIRGTEYKEFETITGIEVIND